MRQRAPWNLRRFAAAFPVTTGFVAVAVGLYAATAVYAARLPNGENDARRQLGAVCTLTSLYQETPDGPLVPIPQKTGQFDLWNGQWWRIPISGFHHGGLWHLAMNSLGLVFLGPLLEPRLGRLRFAAFFLTATTVSLLPEFLLENDVVGLSGGLYALFGALLVLRRTDWRVAEFISPGVVQFGFVWLVGCVIATQMNILRIANVAHFAGLAYGWLAAEVAWGRFSRRWTAWGAFAAAHLAIVPAFYLAMHPAWIGRYHWHLAYQETQIDRKMELLQTAVARDPSLHLAWDQLAEMQLATGDRDAAWRTVLRGLSYTRSNEFGLQLARVIWSEFALGTEQDRALEVLNDVFSGEAAAWQERLGAVAGVPPSRDRLAAEHPKRSDLPLLLQNELLQLQNEFMRGKPAAGAPGNKHDLSAPPVDPDAPDSAAAGVQL